MSSRRHRLRWVLLGAVAAALVIPTSALASHLAGFGHSNPTGGDTITSCSGGYNDPCFAAINSSNFGGGGVLGSSLSGTGVLGTHISSGTVGTGVRGTSASAPYPSAGVAGFNNSSGIGVYGEALSGFAISGFSPNNWAGYFHGRVRVNGELVKNSGSFMIDHPLDPANKYLSHSFVESPDMMNVYNGNVVTNAKGFATVRLPRYFSALNRSFRYQLTPLGDLTLVAVVRKIRNNRFTIRSAKPDVEVSWQVTGIRKDAWANAHRIKVEEAKTGSEAGKYVNPELYGKPLTESVVVLPGMKKADGK